MSLSDPRAFFGVHSVSPYNRTDGTFYGTLKVLKGSSLSLTGEAVELLGGSQKFPWAVEDGAIAAEMSLKVAQFEDFMFELFLGKAPSANSAETTGNVSTAANKKGTSVINGSNGISGVSATSSDEADLKFGKYVIKATGAQVADVFMSSDADHGRGNAGSYTNDLLKIGAIDVSAGNAVLAAYGLTFTKVGTPAFTTGDTATFEVRPVNSKSMTVTIGGAAHQTFNEFGAIIMGQKRGNGELVEVDCFRCKGAGMPIGFEQNAFSETEVKVKAFYDSARDGVFSVRHVTT